MTGAAFAFSTFASTAGATTVADLQAQINALMAQLSAMNGGSAMGSAVQFNTNLTVGSKGADVTALQQLLVSKGMLQMPINVSYGYFGSITKGAVARWQAANGISPAVGYFGPLSRAAANSMVGSTGGTTTGGTTTGGTTTTTGGITTPGAEGIMTVSAGPLSNTVVNVGQTKVPVLAIRVQAQNSDIAVQRINVNLGTNTSIYNKFFSTLYVTDAATGNVLASLPLNSGSVVQSGNNYYANITGFSVVVPKSTYKDIIIRADLYSSIDSTLLTGGQTFQIDANGVRGVDGAGIDQYGPGTLFNQTITVNKSLIDNAQAQVSLAPASPLSNSVAVTDTVNGQYLQLPVFAFNVTAQNDSLHLHNVAVKFVGVPTASANATATAAYLYNGSTQIASASISNTTGLATFSNITDGTAGASIPAGSTVVFTVKADVTGITTGSLALTGSWQSSGTTIYNSQDSTIIATGSATGNTQTILGKGPSAVLTGNPTIAATTVTNQTGNATSTVTATFNVTTTATGADVMFGTQASATPMFVFDILKNGVSTGVVLNASSSAFQLPSTVVNNGSNTFTLSQNSSVTIPVTFSFEDRLLSGAVTGLGSGQYSVNLKQINYVVAGVAGNLSYMAGQTAWTTGSVQGLQ
jgi:hypothetical protein